MDKTKKQDIRARLKTVKNALQKRLRAYTAKRPHRSFRLTDRPRQKLGGQPVPSVFKSLKNTATFIWSERKLLFGLAVLYGLAMYFIAGGISQLDFLALREATLEVFGGNMGAIGTAVTLFGATMTGSIDPESTELQQFLGGLITFIFWLAIVWAARMRLANQAIKIRDALYNSGAPLIPTFILLVILCVQLVPAALGIFVFMVSQSGGWFNGVEAMVFAGVATLLSLLSIYWITATLLAMVVVTLPNMYPWGSLVASSELVIGQRWRLALHIMALIVVTFIGWAIIFIPILLVDSWLRFDWLPLVPIIAQVLTAATLTFTSVYVYKLYRSLL